MSFVVVSPDVVAAAARDAARIRSAVEAANAAAVSQTTSVVVAARDEVSAAIAALFGSYGRQYQQLGAQAAAFHEQIVAALSAGAGAYAIGEAASVSPLQALQEGVLLVINAPTTLLLGRPLIGDGANGAPGTGAAGGAGGLLVGNGGTGGSGVPGGPGGAGIGRWWAGWVASVERAGWAARVSWARRARPVWGSPDRVGLVARAVLGGLVARIRGCCLALGGRVVLGGPVVPAVPAGRAVVA